MNVHLGARVDARVDQRLGQRLVRFGQVDVFADHGDVHFVRRVLERIDQPVPRIEVGRRRVQLQLLADDHVQAFRVQHARDLVDGIRVECRDDGFLRHVGEQRDLLAVAVRHRPVRAAEHDVRLDTDFAQLLHRVLRGLGLHLARGRYVRDERQVDIADVIAAERDPELPDRFEKRQRLDVADRTADFDDGHFGLGLVTSCAGQNPALDLVGDVRNDLHGAAQVIAAPLLADHRFVDLAGGEVVALPQPHVGEALVVAKIEVGLGAIVGNEHFAVLERRHRAGVDVDVGVKLEIGDADAAGGQNRGQGRGGDALAKRGNNAAGHEDEFGHVLLVPEILILRRTASAYKCYATAWTVAATCLRKTPRTAPRRSCCCGNSWPRRVTAVAQAHAPPFMLSLRAPWSNRR